LIVGPSVEGALVLGRRLRRAGLAVAGWPDEWATAAAGGTSVIGARATAWASVPDLAAVVVLEAHDEALVSEQTPAWSGWEVAAERARREAVPCLLLSSCPTVEQLGWGQLVLPGRAAERAGWPAVHVIDRRGDDPRTGLFSERLVEIVRGASAARPVWCVLNRKGRARLLVCPACGEVAVCERCGASVSQAGNAGTLRCPNCATERPALCASCGSTRLRALRAGVDRAREQLAALALQPVGEVTADTVDDVDAAILIGTEALLHRRGPDPPGVVAFLDFDAELLAPRYRAFEQALVLLVRAATRLGGRDGGGLLVVQTRQPEHVVISSAVRADPGRLAEADRTVRKSLGLPPFQALALIAGPGAVEFSAALRARGRPVEVVDLSDGRWLVRAANHDVLCDALAETPRPPGRLRVEVDPRRV